MTLRAKIFLSILLASIIVLSVAFISLNNLEIFNQDIINQLLSQQATALNQAQLEQLQLQYKAEKNNVLLVAVLAVIIAAALVIAVINSAFVNFTKIRHAMRQVGEGDLTGKLLIQSNDELGRLGSDFNQMIDRLSAYQADLDDIATRYRAITEAAADAIITTDELGIIQSWNHAATKIFGYPQSQALGQNISFIMPESLRREHDGYMSRYLQNNSARAVVGAGARELMGVRQDGIQVPIEVSITEMFINDERMFVGVIRDITERKTAAEEVAYLTQYDTLTNLANRSSMRETLVEAMERATRGERLLGLLQIDLDRFMAINDSLGHDIGDELLVAVAERIQTVMSSGDHLARTGGDEFCIVLENMQHVMHASVFAENLIEAIDAPFTVQEHDIYITLSIGIAIFPFDDDTPEILLKNAEAAMQRCKSDGGSDFRFYSDDMNASSLERVRLTADLRTALDNREFVLFYQPQIEMASGKPVGAEALIRWQHPQLGLIPPGQFISLLEETGLILPVGEWAIREACKQNAIWHRQGLDKFRVAINLSIRQFKDNQLVNTLTDILDETGLEAGDIQPMISASAPMPSGCIELELTEGMLMDNTSSSCSTLKAFKEMGVKISVDDFGTGYSSLSYLKQFPLDTLKVDQSFVRDVGKGQDSELIIQAIIDLAHNLRLEVIGEGVETRQQLKFLHEKGCDQIQGYLLARPMPVDEMQQWLDQWNPDEFFAIVNSQS